MRTMINTKEKIQKGFVIAKMLPATQKKSGFVIEGGSRKLPANKAEVLGVGEGDEFGENIWEVGDTIIVPNSGVVKFDKDGELLIMVHHRRICYGYGS